MYEESLKQYVNEDTVYKRYKTGETGFNDFEKFCIKHCKDIESLLEQNRSLKSQLEFVDEQNRYIEKLEKRIDKLKEIEEDHRRINGELRKENKQLKDKLSKIETLTINHNCDTGDIYYKYNGKYLKSEFKERLLEILKGDSNE